jgi:hypothetical protein
MPGVQFRRSRLVDWITRKRKSQTGGRPSPHNRARRLGRPFRCSVQQGRVCMFRSCRQPADVMRLALPALSGCDMSRLVRVRWSRVQTLCKPYSPGFRSGCPTTAPGVFWAACARAACLSPASVGRGACGNGIQEVARCGRRVFSVTIARTRARGTKSPAWQRGQAGRGCGRSGRARPVARADMPMI